MRNKKQILKKISQSITKHYGDSADFQIIWALNKDNDNSAKIIEVIIVPGPVLNDIMRMEKIESLNGGSDPITEKRLHDAIRSYTRDFDISIEEFLPF